MGAIDMVIATCKHRLDQLTKPAFDRATVEELLAEIFRLRSVDHRNQVAKEIAWRDNKIDELTEANEELSDEVEGLTETVAMQRARISDLETVNSSLSRHLNEAMLGSPERTTKGPKGPNRVLPMRPSAADLDEAVRRSASKPMPMISQSELRAEKVSQERADLMASQLNQLKALPSMELTDEGLAVIKGGKR